jgi:hypothetical protein
LRGNLIIHRERQREREREGGRAGGAEKMQTLSEHSNFTR